MKPDETIIASESLLKSLTGSRLLLGFLLVLIGVFAWSLVQVAPAIGASLVAQPIWAAVFAALFLVVTLAIAMQQRLRMTDDQLRSYMVGRLDEMKTEHAADRLRWALHLEEVEKQWAARETRAIAREELCRAEIREISDRQTRVEKKLNDTDFGPFVD